MNTLNYNLRIITIKTSCMFTISNKRIISDLRCWFCNTHGSDSSGHGKSFKTDSTPDKSRTKLLYPRTRIALGYNTVPRVLCTCTKEEKSKRTSRDEENSSGAINCLDKLRVGVSLYRANKCVYYKQATMPRRFS